jgi:dolichol-phosphate mannosyltransferase
MISIIIPAYNEADNIKPIAGRIALAMEGCHPFEIIFVDDGSTDETLAAIRNLAAVNPNVKYLSFSRNFGHQRALKAGYDYAKGDCVISMDADMQHPPELLGNLIEKWQEGFDVVYTVRVDSTQTSIIKKWTSRWFYRSVNLLADVNIPLGAADFRLLDRKVVDELKKFRENWLFIRGIVAWLGFRQIGIEFAVGNRLWGRSKYSFLRMISLAVQGITSFSIMPLRIAIFLGLSFSAGAFLYSIYVLIVKFVNAAVIPGWTSILISVLFLGGIQLICVGLIGEYLGKMFIESKARPVYVIKDKNIE